MPRLLDESTTSNWFYFWVLAEVRFEEQLYAISEDSRFSIDFAW